MTLKVTNPALRAAATGLGSVVTGQVFDAREVTPSLHEIQNIFVRRRTRLWPNLARVVAELHFGRKAA